VPEDPDYRRGRRPADPLPAALSLPSAAHSRPVNGNVTAPPRADALLYDKLSRPVAPRPAPWPEAQPAGGEDREGLRVLLYDQCEVYRAGVRAVLESAPDVRVVGEAGDVDAVCLKAARTSPSLLLVGTQSGDDESLVRELVARVAPGVPVLVLTPPDEGADALPLLAAGAKGYLGKDTPSAPLLHAVRCVCAGSVVLTPPATEQIVRRATAPAQPRAAGSVPAEARSALAGLTPRQLEVLVLVAEGFSNVEIAHRMQVSVPTVKSHLSGILRKIDVRDRTQLAVLAHQHGVRLT
jgi:DNA-binding NarL/FixJ family response regulator